MLRTLFAFLFLLAACAAPSVGPAHEPAAALHGASRVVWKDAPGVDVADFNRDLVAGRPTVDLGVYFPSNLDPAFDKVTLPQLLESVRAAKQIFAPTGVQLKLIFVRTGAVDPSVLALSANEVPLVPQTEYANLYEHARRHPAMLTAHARAAFESIVEPSPEAHRTVYLIVLQDVFMPFLEVAEGRNWTIKTVRTGGLSFPAYLYPGTLPAMHRGVITITNLARPDRLRRTVAHELGHKLINVSHEYRETNPDHEVFAEGGLMVYGSGEAIDAGAAGRWHRERLLASPFIYRLEPDGTRRWNPDYREGGHYYDPLYGAHAVHFRGRAVIDPNW